MDYQYRVRNPDGSEIAAAEWPADVPAREWAAAFPSAEVPKVVLERRQRHGQWEWVANLMRA